MAEDQDKTSFYPIQLEHLAPRELFIKSYRPHKDPINMDESDLNLSVGYGEYDAENKSVVVSLKLEIGQEPEHGKENSENKFPFFLRIELFGFFSVDDSVFPLERLEEWVKSNSFFILHPYLREQAYSLTARAGYYPLILPLVQIPTMKIIAQTNEQ